jgi:hypothetical protein
MIDAMSSCCIELEVNLPFVLGNLQRLRVLSFAKGFTIELHDMTV